MKQTTEKMLKKELYSHKYTYGENGIFQKPLRVLFEKYLEAEVDSVDQFLSMFNVSDAGDTEYFCFVSQYKDYINVSKKCLERQDPLDKATILDIGIRRDVSSIIYKCNDWNVTMNQKFVDIVNGVVEYSSILDVGSSCELPISSLLFARGSGKVTSMDKFKEFWYNTKVFKKLNIDVKSKYFDNNTDISKYDAIVGASPCSAITPIVEQCSEVDDTTYFIEMCDCCSPRGGITGFVEYLKAQDDRLKAFVVATDIDTKKKDFCLARQGQNLDDWGMEVYITNSDKHSDDILDILSSVNTK